VRRSQVAELYTYSIVILFLNSGLEFYPLAYMGENFKKEYIVYGSDSGPGKKMMRTCPRLRISLYRNYTESKEKIPTMTRH
jgi:hypothetical protein